jgi:hypothetical protein
MNMICGIRFGDNISDPGNPCFKAFLAQTEIVSDLNLPVYYPSQAAAAADVSVAFPGQVYLDHMDLADPAQGLPAFYVSGVTGCWSPGFGGTILSFSVYLDSTAAASTPDNTINYTYVSSVVGSLLVLSAVYNPSTANPIVNYRYSPSTYFPCVLIEQLDEHGNAYVQWTYDSGGRVLTSQHGVGADLTTVSYDDATDNHTVSSALGQSELYTFTTLLGEPKLTEIDCLATATTTAATRLFTYDTNGYIASQTYWNGNLTVYVKDDHGQPTIITDASGTPVARLPSLIFPTTICRRRL